MPSKGGWKIQEKKLRYQIKIAITDNQDPFSFFQKLEQLNNKRNSRDLKPDSFKPQEDIEYKYPDYREIRIGDPRRVAYKIRNLFGFDEDRVIIPNSYPVLPAVDN